LTKCATPKPAFNLLGALAGAARGLLGGARSLEGASLKSAQAQDSREKEDAGLAGSVSWGTAGLIGMVAVVAGGAFVGRRWWVRSRREDGPAAAEGRESGPSTLDA
jgi:hypothetical protein